MVGAVDPASGLTPAGLVRILVRRGADLGLALRVPRVPVLSPSGAVPCAPGTRAERGVLEAAIAEAETLRLTWRAGSGCVVGAVATAWRREGPERSVDGALRALRDRLSGAPAPRAQGPGMTEAPASEGLAPGEVAGLAPGEVAGLAPGEVEGLAPGEVEGLAPGEVEGLAPGEVAGLAPGEVAGLAPGEVAAPSSSDRSLPDRGRSDRPRPDWSLPDGLAPPVDDLAASARAASRQALEAVEPRLARAVEQRLGLRYREEGNGRDGFIDGPQFVRDVYLDAFGVDLGADIEELLLLGPKIDFTPRAPERSLRPGDLLFFVTYAGIPRSVMVYLGAGQIAHATRILNVEVKEVPISIPNYLYLVAIRPPRG